ncbi:MAG: hypothetical protein FWC89_05280 [Defluviitaleaceae bacterium]|nr:hypothetical protein [Defluviitaleaceae bacterium]
MNRKDGKGFKKMMGIAALSIGLFSSAFVGVNHLAFAASTSATSAPLVMESVTIPTVSTLSETSVGAFAASRSGEETHRQLSIEFGNWIPGPEMAFGTPTVNCISVVEAAEIAADTLEQLFDVNLDGATLFMTYWEGQDDVDANWNGQIFPNNELCLELMPQFSFTINAGTGELMDASYNLFALEAFEAGIRGRTATTPNIEAMQLLRTLNAQDNQEIAIHAMNITQGTSLLNGEVTRARIDRYEIDFAIPSGEPMLRIFVIVQNENNDSIRLSFQELVNENPILHLAIGSEQTRLQEARTNELMLQFGFEREESKFDWVNR